MILSRSLRLAPIVLLAFGGLSLTGCGKKAKSAGPAAPACLAEGITMEGDGSIARPAQCMSACTSDDECIAVNTSCPGCCEFEAISARYENAYEKDRMPECRKYQGLVCSCSEAKPAATCVSNVCQLAMAE